MRADGVESCALAPYVMRASARADKVLLRLRRARVRLGVKAEFRLPLRTFQWKIKYNH